MKQIQEMSQIPAVRKYLARIGAVARGMRHAVVQEQMGRYWRDLALIRMSDSGEVSVKGDGSYAPTEGESGAIKAAWGRYAWPQHKILQRVPRQPPIKAGSTLYVYRNLDGHIIMMQERRVMPGGEKRFVPWTYWNDRMWRACEPPGGKLPLWGMEQLKSPSSTTAFIHEGAGAAEVCLKIEQSHPWHNELGNALHLGWIGGALNPHRTDWGCLVENGIKRVYIVSDNDEPGRHATPAIAQQIRCPCLEVQFTDEFPASFDLGDAFPESMLGDGVYTGPLFRDCVHPATWCTDEVVPPKGRRYYVLRDSFKNQWAYVEENDQFVLRQNPSVIRTGDVLNKMLAPYSHVKDTVSLILKAQRGRQLRMVYRPDCKQDIITDSSSRAINVHTPTRIQPNGTSYGPWMEFMRYLVPEEEDLHQTLRWCATLIAHPEVRIGYGLLLVSETQGIGKTTLGSAILAPLVGMHNCSWPGEQDLLNPFNEWIAHKRLAIVNEIYQGRSWKSYNLLKAAITDREIEVNRKHIRQYRIDNWCHIFACSNSKRALKIDKDDRRWLHPVVNEVAWPRESFIELRRWIEHGGLGAVMRWAMDFDDPISPAEHAPMTEQKKELIEESFSDEQKEAMRLMGMAADSDRPIALFMRDIVRWIQTQVGRKPFDSDAEIRSAMKQVAGASVFPQRIKADGVYQYAVLNQKAEIRLEQARKTLLQEQKKEGSSNAGHMERGVKRELRGMRMDPFSVCEEDV